MGPRGLSINQLSARACRNELRSIVLKNVCGALALRLIRKAVRGDMLDYVGATFLKVLRVLHSRESARDLNFHLN